MRKTPFVLAVLLAVAGTCVMLWPVVTGYRLQANTDEAVQSFLEERKPEQQYPELLAALQEYNRQLYAERQSRLIDLEACEEPAADLTAYGIEDEVIGVLEIPAMELTMPVYLGASDAHLAEARRCWETHPRPSVAIAPTASLPDTGAGAVRTISGISTACRWATQCSSQIFGRR